MTDYDLANVVLLIDPRKDDRAVKACYLEHNANRLVVRNGSANASLETRTLALDASRQVTPFCYVPPEPLLQLTFTVPPIDIIQGTIFGSDASQCDVLLDTDPSSGVSRKHFSIDFNWSSGILLLTNHSRFNTTLNPHGEKISLRVGERWSLNPIAETVIRVGLIDIAVSVPDRGDYQGEYEKNFLRALKLRERSLPRFELILEEDQDVTVNVEAAFDKKLSVVRCIGTGRHGTVFEAMHKTSGTVYALKRRHESTDRGLWENEIKILPTLEHVRQVAQI